jgi:hypothetical protein
MIVWMQAKNPFYLMFLCLCSCRVERAGPEARPDSDAYNFVIALCALNRRIPAALKHMQSMYERKLVPSKTTYNEVLLGCARVHRTQLADAVMKQMKVGRNGNNYSCV